MSAERDERELLGLWLSRLMFNEIVGFPPETRSAEEFCADHGHTLGVPEAENGQTRSET